MKKFLTLILLCAATQIAWAQTVVNTDAEIRAAIQNDGVTIRVDALKNVAVNVAVNTKYLSERLGVNRKTIQRDAVALQEKHLIQWVGSDKTGHWEIIEK